MGVRTMAGARALKWSGWRALCASAAFTWIVAVGTAQASELVSVATTGGAGNAASSGVGTNLDASVIGFFSDATTLVTRDTNQARDVFVRDDATGTIERVSISSSGGQANRASHAAGGAVAVNADGSIVAFYSDASNLVDTDTNSQRDVFVRDRSAGTTVLVSVSSDGVQGNGASLYPSISANGRRVAFQSQASNLVAGDLNGVADIFVRDLDAGTTVRACAIEGNQFSSTPAISDDGSTVAFASGASNFVAGDDNAAVDIFVCDVASGAVARVSVGPNGVSGNGDSILPALSADGRFVSFKSLANNLVAGDRNGVVDVFLHDRQTGVTERISVDRLAGDADDFSFPPSVSDDGRFVAFGSFATDLIMFDLNQVADVFVRDRNIGRTLQVGKGPNGQQANRGTPDIPPAISGDGTQIAFVSFATNLDPADLNQASDVYLEINPFFGPGSCPNGDDDCPDGEVCVDGFCAAATPTPPPASTPTPTATPTRTSTPTPTPTFQPCETDDDCPDGKICRGGFCRDPRPCDPNDPAIDLLQCFERETCIGNLCECGGDCNIDGYVLGTEITRAILILAGARELDQCAAADIDLDGAVMGNEITLAIINLDEGCLQEGRPLLFAHDRNETVTLRLDSSVAPSGASAEVTVSLEGGNDEVATVQLDLLYDPSQLTLSDPAAACRKDPRLDGQVIIAAAPNSPPAPDGLARLRLFVGSTAAPVGTFGEGPVVSCTFGLPASPGSEVTLVPERLNVGDDRGNTFRVLAAQGSVVVPVPTPTPAPEVPTCAGDCDADGSVLGNEITRAVRIMVGDSELADCPAADGDGDREVFVTDITRAVIHMGLGCPE